MSDSLQEIVCCMGQPVAGNPTQFMMERALADCGLDWRYLTLEVPPENLADAVRGLRAMGFRGGNFTIPHKVAVIQHLDGLTQAAELMQAVNCVYREGAKLIGENTDGKGFVQSLREIVDPAGQRVAILGAGGAARAIAVELGLAGAAHIQIINRSAARGHELVALLQQRCKVSTEYLPWNAELRVPESAQILINATSIGLNDAQARVPIAADSLRPELIVADVVFNPPQTQLLQAARQRGCRTLDGLGMLVNQAVIGFEIWTGVTPRAQVMREALEEYLSI
jgi:shikimate dehydrogenase